MKNSTINQRIAAIYESLEINQAEFSRRINFSQSRLNNQILGKNGLKYDIILAIARKYPNLNLSWLIDEVGEMWNQENLNQENLNQESAIVNEPEKPYKSQNDKPPEKKVEEKKCITDMEYLKKAVEMLQVENFKLRERVENLERKNIK